MKRFCQGDTAAFDELYTRHSATVHGFLTRMVGDRSLAEDLLQTTFLSVLRARNRFDPDAKFSSWLYAIAANAARDALRKRARTPEDFHPSEVIEQATASTMTDPSLSKRIQHALEQLPIAQREAVILHRIYGWTFEQMAEALGENPNTMRVRAHRADARLRELLGDLAEDTR